ncbi:MAG: redoxin domain-containing protein [Kiritimatiellae bacterium]|nr:redoxin domain-containing protein [Kiritimatiellia bacterium]HOU20836.1 thioredoxin domain-containing protein [Kiritimatiellia bacterium]HPC19281.1 thioredoxin domain-containing protein [Kiritimatiellia bacterium]HQQ60226.1 thioredoxin domain-containing protein [Kiritimatiellia bacterium]
MKKPLSLLRIPLALLPSLVLAIPQVGEQTANLSVGSSVPALKASKWIKGEAVSGFEPEQTCVVEFWATWCPPCRASIPRLTELAHKFTNMMFIGMNVWERGEKPADKVADFVEKMGDQMDYRVAMDTEDGFMAKQWMQAAGQRGIPAAFVVHQGAIAWIGHPMSGLEEILREIADGDFDPARARERAAMKRREAAESRRIAETYEDYLEAVGPNGDREKAADLARKIEQMDINSPDNLNAIAWTILTHPGIEERDIPLATHLAKKALEATQEKRADILDTYARALWDAGQTAAAIEYQKKAVATDPADRGLAVTLERYLDQARPEGPPLALATERFGSLAAAVDDAIYVLGGHSDRGMVGTIERFSADSHTTETLPATIRPRRFFAGAAGGGKIYIVGGLMLDDSQDDIIMTASCEEYDPATGTIRALPDLPVAVSRAGAAVVGNRLVVIGGAQGEEEPRFKIVQIYDIETETWTRGADLPVAREGQVFESGGKIYAPGGYDGTTALRDFQVYDPAEDKWSELPKLPVKTSAYHGCVLDGQLYLFGDYEELDRTVVCDLEKKKWARIDLGYKPARHAALAQLGEDIFVVGGNVQSTSPYLARIQRFSAKQLADAPRKKWKAAAKTEAVSKPAPMPGDFPSLSAPADVSSNRTPRRAVRCGFTRTPIPPDTRFFRLKWKQELDDHMAQSYIRGRIDWRIPPRHLALTSDRTLFIHRADDGTLLHTIPLPPEARDIKESLGSGRFSFVFLQDGSHGCAIGTRSLYEVAKTDTGGRSFRSAGQQSLCLSDAGELRWDQKDPGGGFRDDFYALPIGPNRDLLLTASRGGFKIMDAERRILLEQACRGSWIFRPAPSGKGVEALVIDQDIACYEVVVPTEGSTAEPRLSYAERRRQRALARAANNAETAPKEQPRKREELRSTRVVEPRPRSKIDFFTERLDKNPNDVNALHWRGFLYAMRGDAQASRRDFEKAIRLAPDVANIRWSYGWALLNLGEYDQAARQWEIMGELDEAVPPNGDHHLALAYWAAGQKEQALKIFNATVARVPGCWISRDHARRYTAQWTEKEKAILFSLHDAWCRIYTPPANPADYPLPEPDQPASEP